MAHHRVDGSADCDGIDVAPETLDALTANTRLTQRLEDANGIEIKTSRARTALPADVERHLIERDPHCRVPGCERRWGLQNHHLLPCCHDGDDSIHNIARVCPSHHRMLTPHGPWHLVGDPEQIDGLHLVHHDDMTDELIDTRAGPAP